MRLLLTLPALLAALPALAQPPALPERVCVPSALLNQIAASDAQRPWGEVAAIMDQLRTIVSAPAACEAPAPAPATEK